MTFIGAVGCFPIGVYSVQVNEIVGQSVLYRLNTIFDGSPSRRRRVAREIVGASNLDLRVFAQLGVNTGRVLRPVAGGQTY